MPYQPHEQRVIDSLTDIASGHNDPRARAMADKPDARQVTLNRSTVEAMLAALDGKSVTSLSDAERLIQQQRYSTVEDALAAADGKMGEDAVTCFLNALRYADED